jgi:N4-gp56 family major capsid protein
MRGSSVTIEKIEYFAAAAITAAKTPLTEESDVDSTKIPRPSTVVLTPAEYGFAVTTTRKLTNRTFSPVDPIKVALIATHQARVIDELVQDKLVTGTAVYNNSNTVETTIAPTHVLTATDVRRQVAKLRAGNVTPWFGGYYAAYAHPFVVLDLREATGAANWREPNVYGQDQSKIWSGEIGEFEGVRFVQSNLNRVTQTGTGSGGTQTRVFNTFFIGKGALAETVVEEPHVEFAPPVDKLNRFATLGWYGDIGWSLYESKALYVVKTSSSAQSDYVASA